MFYKIYYFGQKFFTPPPQSSNGRATTVWVGGWVGLGVGVGCVRVRVWVGEDEDVGRRG
jgi:hypothetical protein